MTALIQSHVGGFLAVGVGAPDSYAADCGANVAPDEAAVLLPQAVMDAHEKPLRDRIAELKAARERAARTAGRLQCHADEQRARAERAEAAARDTAALAALRLTDLLASIRAVAEPLEALAIGAGGEGGDLRWGIALRHARALTALAGTADTTSNEGD